MRYVWQYFKDLTRRRSNNGFGPLPLQFSEILSYFNLYKIDYEPFEVKLIELLDDVFIQHYIDNNKSS